MTSAGPQAASPRRLAICSAVAESSRSIALLKQRGFVIRVSASPGAADVVLPAPRGSLAFLLHAGTLPTAAIAPLAERAMRASRAARQCTVLCVCTDDCSDALEALQVACPGGVSALVCPSHDDAVEHMVTCSQHVEAARVNNLADMPEQQATERACGVLAALWGAERHSIDFMLAARPLSSMAKVTCEEEWQQLLLETDGLLDPELLYTCVDWLQRDQVLLW